MDSGIDEITREPLERYERSAKTYGDKKDCIWGCALRLMEAHDPDATAHISMIGHRIGVGDYDIRTVTRNAARRTGWNDARAGADAKPHNDEYSPGVRELVTDHTTRAYLGDCPACRVRMAAGAQQPALMNAHARANGMTFDEMWNTPNSDDPWDTPPVNPAPEFFDPLVDCRVHARPGDWWPSDFPDCKYCRKACRWFDTHYFDDRRLRWVKNSDAPIGPREIYGDDWVNHVNRFGDVV
jgi:hypothetical protein